MDGLLSARTPPSDDWPAARRRLAFCRNARKVRGANPHVRDDIPRTGPRQELTVGCRKRKFLVGRASTLLGKGGIWELGRRGHAAADGPSPQLKPTASQPGQGAGPTNHRPQGEGNRGRQRPARPICLLHSADAFFDGSHPITAVRRALPPFEEIGDAEHRPRIPLPELNRAGTEDRVDGASLAARFDRASLRAALRERLRSLPSSRRPPFSAKASEHGD